MKFGKKSKIIIGVLATIMIVSGILIKDSTALGIGVALALIVLVTMAVSK